MSNPWLQIPLRDYEGHMAHATVAQAQMLSAVLGEAVAEFRPRSLAVLGVAGGNGLEVIDPAMMPRVVALDINPEYLAACTRRHAHRFDHFETIPHDLTKSAPSFAPVELIFGGLLLEYLDCDTFLGYLPSLLVPRGVFVTLLQLPSPNAPAVSQSPFLSVRDLESTFHFVEPEALRSALANRGFACCAEKLIRLESAKEFLWAAFRLNENFSRQPVGPQAALNQ